MKRIICLIISALVMSCSQVNVPITQEIKATPKPAPIQSVVVNNQVKIDTKVVTETKQEIKISVPPTPEPTPTPTITPIPSTNVIQVVPTPTPMPHESGVSEPFSVLPSNTLPPLNIPLDNPYYLELPTPDGNIGTFYLLFKDECKIRYNRDKKQFYSLVGYDTKSINEILISENIKIEPSNSIFTEEQMDEMERLRQRIETGDVAHYGSIYTIETKNISNIELVNKMRANPYVRQFNYNKSNFAPG